jgi:gas vesicle protein
MSRNRSSFPFAQIAWTVGGIAMGALAGVLLAPASGRDTRKKWLREYEEQKKVLSKKGRRALDDFTEYATDRIEEGKQRVSELVGS